MEACFDTKMILEFLIGRILGDKINKKDAILYWKYGKHETRNHLHNVGFCERIEPSMMW